MTSSQNLRRFVDELWLCFAESAEYHRSIPSVCDVLQQAAKVMSLLRRRLAVEHDRYVVAFVGATNVGKSTLLNRLFGEELAPKRNGPCTAIPIEFEYHATSEVRVAYHNDFRPLIIPCAGREDVHAELKRVAADVGIESAQSIRRVTACVPHALLKTMAIADTPGFGAVQAPGAEESHERALLAYLAEGVGRVIWVTQSEQGIGSREMAFYREHLASVCDDVVFTHCEDWSQRDSRRYADRFLPVFGRERPRLHFTSAVEGLGVEELHTYLLSTAAPDRRFRDAVERTEHLAIALDAWFSATGDRLTTVRLRPDGRLRLQASPACEGLRDRVLKHLDGAKQVTS